MEILTFEQLPTAVATLSEKVDQLTILIRAQAQPDPDRWFDIGELCAYLPDKPSPTTVYGWAQARSIPHGRNGKKLIFLKSQIDQWLRDKSRKTSQQTEALAEGIILQRSIIKRRTHNTRAAK